MIEFDGDFGKKALSGKSSHVGIFGLFVPTTYIFTVYKNRLYEHYSVELSNFSSRIDIGFGISKGLAQLHVRFLSVESVILKYISNEILETWNHSPRYKAWYIALY